MVSDSSTRWVAVVLGLVIGACGGLEPNEAGESDEAVTQAARRITLLGNLNPRPPNLGPDGALQDFYADVKGYAAGDREFALQASVHGVSVIDVTNPKDKSTFREVSFIPLESTALASPSTPPVTTAPTHGFGVARVIATHGHYAYIGGQPNSNLYVVDLSDPDKAKAVAELAEYKDQAHTIQAANGFLYLNDAQGRCHVLDLADPMHPTRAAVYAGIDCHDSHIVGDRLYVAGGWKGVWDIVDIADPKKPKLVGRTPRVDGIYAHSGWLSADKQFFFGMEELNKRDILIFDFSTPTAPKQVGTFSLPENSIAHNAEIRGKYLHVAHYESGYIVLDVSKPLKPKKVGQYKTWKDPPNGRMRGAWNVDTRLPSGNVIVSDMKSGTFVFKVK